MVLSAIAAVVVVVLFSAGPVVVNDGVSCSRDSVDPSEQQSVSCSCTKCDVDQVQAAMSRKTVPKELKVEIEGRLYSVPDNAEMVTRTPQVEKKTKWWKRFVRKDRSLSGNSGDGDASDNARPSGSDPATRSVDDGEAAADKAVPSAGEYSCQICFGQDHSTAILPCGHGGLCWDCGLQVYALTQECPFCRSKVELLVPLDSRTRRFEGDDEYVASAECSEDGKPLLASRSDTAPMHSGS